MARYPIPDCDPLKPHCTELLIRRSRFLAQCVHVQSVAEGREFVERSRQLYPDASHHCWACVAGEPGNSAQTGCSDDGEPSGTAGRPMLQILLHSEVGEICVVVTRWFGGIKLGVGGLARAYKDSVRTNLDSLQRKEKITSIEFFLQVGYPDLDKVKRLLPLFEVKTLAENYREQIALQISVPEENSQQLLQSLKEITNGNITITGSMK